MRFQAFSVMLSSYKVKENFRNLTADGHYNTRMKAKLTTVINLNVKHLPPPPPAATSNGVLTFTEHRSSHYSLP
jgi:hypothetical protein